MATKAKKSAAPGTDWDQGAVIYIITDHNGKSNTHTQMCWNRGRFRARMEADAAKSQQEKETSKRYNVTFAK